MLVPLLIGMACSNVEPMYQNACSKAMEAGTKQSQVYQYDEKGEGYFRVYAQKQATDFLGEDTFKAIGGTVGGTVFLYNTAKSRSISFNLPTFGLCNSANNQISLNPNSSQIILNTYRINLNWSLNWLK